MPTEHDIWQGVKKICISYAPPFSPEQNSGTTNGVISKHEVFTEMPFIRPMSHKGQLQTMIRYVQIA